MPVMQWLYFDALECLSEDAGVQLTEEECAPVGIYKSKHQSLISSPVVTNPKVKLFVLFCVHLLEELSL